MILLVLLLGVLALLAFIFYLHKFYEYEYYMKRVRVGLRPCELSVLGVTGVYEDRRCKKLVRKQKV